MDIDKINQLYYTNRKLLQEQSEKGERVFYASVPLKLEHYNKPDEYEDSLREYPGLGKIDVSYKIYFDFVKNGLRSISTYDVEVKPFTIYDEIDEYAINVDFGGKEIDMELGSPGYPIKITFPFVPSFFKLVVDGITPIAEKSTLIF